MERFKELYEDGQPFSAIGRVLGCSRNAAIGKAARMGLKRGAAVIRRNSQVARVKLLSEQREARNAAKPKREGPSLAALIREKIIERPSEIVVPAEQMVTIVDLEPHHCRFPVGDPATPEFRFCGGTRLIGVSYCESHYLRLRYRAPEHGKRSNIDARPLFRHGDGKKRPGGGIGSDQGQTAAGGASERESEDA